MADAPTLNLDAELKERFLVLPKVVRDAITSSDVQNRMRSLANSYKLHLDQWDALENTVILTLLGLHSVADLARNIQKKVGVGEEQSRTLAANISHSVFEPIREELERQLEHPEAREKEVSGVETARASALASAQPVASSQQPAANSESATGSGLQAPGLPAPATPPPPAPDIKVTRPSESTAYKPGESSTARGVVDDPYREPPV